MSDGGDRLGRGRDERLFVERVARHYAPPESTPARRAAFDEALRQRLEAPRRGRGLAPALVGVGAALLLAVGVWTASEAPRVEVADGAWEVELLLSSDVSPSEDSDEGDYLPDDYLAIASVFLES
ncbi:MAG: hypothetical protein ABFS46_12065 [Myxococcota bacterium]